MAPARRRAPLRRDVYQLTVRRADVDERGLVRDVAFFEYFQEARIQFLMSLHTRGQQWSHHVVARTDIDYLEPMPHRQEPYAVRSWIGHVGTQVVHDPGGGARRRARAGPRRGGDGHLRHGDPAAHRHGRAQRARLLQELA